MVSRLTPDSERGRGFRLPDLILRHTGEASLVPGRNFLNPQGVVVFFVFHFVPAQDNDSSLQRNWHGSS